MQAVADSKKKKKIKGFGGGLKKKVPAKAVKIGKAAKAAKTPALKVRPKCANNTMDKDRYGICLRLPERLRAPLNAMRLKRQESVNTYIYNLICVALANDAG